MQTITIGPIGFPEKDGDQPYMASDFKAQLDQADPSQPLYLDFHSEGGSVVEGYRIQQLLNEYPGKIVGRVRCMAFSIASYALMECDEIEIAENGFVMVHNPYSQPEGDSRELAKQADFLGQLQSNMVAKYSERTGLSTEDVQALLDAETYIGATQAIELGFADRIIGGSTSPREPQALAYREQIGNMPSLVLAAMRSPLEGKLEPAQRPKEKTVSEKTLASVLDIERAFPKASAEFIVRCMKKEMAMEDVGEEYAKAMEDENTSMKAEMKAMKEEMAEMKAMLNPDDPSAMDPNAGGSDPSAYNNPGEMNGGGGASARGRVNPMGHNPVTNVQSAGSAIKDPQTEWNALVDSFKAKGMSNAKSVVAATRAAPKLREAFIQSKN